MLFLILNLQMDPALVDVNVHPAKLEVRFEEENKVFKSVYYAVKEALSKKELVADAVEEKTIPKQEIAQEIATPIQNIAPVQNEVPEYARSGSVRSYLPLP